MDTNSNSSPLVLVLEDEALIGLNLRDDLQDAGYRVEGPFTTCAAALEWLQMATPDMAVLDAALKDGPCREIALELDRRDVPFVIYSGYHEDRQLLVEFPHTTWIEKPLRRLCLWKHADSFWWAAPQLLTWVNSFARTLLRHRRSHTSDAAPGHPFVVNEILPWNESDRLAALRSYRVLDTPPEPEFDALVQLAARQCRTPVAWISLIDDRRQWFKAEVGLGVRETPLDRSICLTAMLGPGLTIVPDLTEDPRFAANPLVTGEPHLRFYAGAVLRTSDGLPLGALCVLDHIPRELTEDQAFTLTTLAQQVMSQLNLRRVIAEQDDLLEASRKVEERQSLLVRELHHRVKNTLATVQALVGATGRSTGSFDAFYRSFSDRITSLARTHNLLTEDYWQTAPLREIALNELKPFAESRQPRFMLLGPSVELAADLAVPVGMALHELTTNAVRYGALSVAEGYVELRWGLSKVEGVRRLTLEWMECGGPPVAEPQHKGFGSTLLQRVLPLQCSAEVEVTYDRAGLRFRLDAPLIERRLVPEY